MEEADAAPQAEQAGPKAAAQTESEQSTSSHDQVEGGKGAAVAAASRTTRWLERFHEGELAAASAASDVGDVATTEEGWDVFAPQQVAASGDSGGGGDGRCDSGSSDSGGGWDGRRESGSRRTPILLSEPVAASVVRACSLGRAVRHL